MKTKIFILAIILLLLSTLPVFAVIGDVNEDTTIDIIDAMLTARFAAGLNPSDFNYSSADANCDGAVDILDALMIARHSVGLIVITPCPSGIISPDNPAITFDGIWFHEISPDRVILNRFTREVLDHPETYASEYNANTQTGVVVRFSTASPSVKFLVENRTDSKLAIRNFGVYLNGEWFDYFTFKDFTINTGFTAPGTVEVVMPALWGYDFLGLELTEGFGLVPNQPSDRPVYVAVGDSITHGNGQATYQTYPFHLARQKGWELVNLAVGGSGTSHPFGELFEGQKVDIVSVLWGFNDWNMKNNKAQMITDYNLFLDKLRLHQPEAVVYIILPIHTDVTTPGTDNGETIQDVRDALVEMVTSRQDPNLFYINGNDYTDSNSLKDGIHLSVEGAAAFAGSLNTVMNLP